MIVSIKVGVISAVDSLRLLMGKTANGSTSAHAAIPCERRSDNQRRILPADQYRRLLIRTVGWGN